jgi:hypothetical protein
MKCFCKNVGDGGENSELGGLALERGDKLLKNILTNNFGEMLIRKSSRRYVSREIFLESLRSSLRSGNFV